MRGEECDQHLAQGSGTGVTVAENRLHQWALLGGIVSNEGLKKFFYDGNLKIYFFSCLKTDYKFCILKFLISLLNL